MRLLYICQHFGFPDQPTGTRAYDLATSFVKEGLDVTILTTTNSMPNLETHSRWGYIERDGLKIYAVKCPYDQTMTFRRRILSFIQFLFYASIKSLKIKCDLVLATSTPLTVGIPALVKKTLGRTPYVFEVRDVWPDVPIKMGILRNPILNWMLEKLEKRIYRRASGIVPLSVGMKQNILSRIKMSDKRLVTIPNISEINRFANISERAEELFPFDVAHKKIVLYCGTFGRVNGLGYLVSLAAETAKIDPSIVYCIFGKGNEKEDILQRAKELGVLDKTFFYGGRVVKEKIPSLYYTAAVGSSFVIDNPALWDNSANKFFDTLAAKRPMLINHEGWQADVIRQYKCGYVLPPVVTSEVAQDFVTFMQNEAQLKDCGENAYNLAKEQYALSVATKKYLDLFSNVQIRH